MKLTSKTVAAAALPAGKRDHFEWDSELRGYGLRLRLGSGGRLLRTFNVQYRRGGATRRLLLGSADVLGAAEARSAARQALAEIRLGRDPSAERRERRDKDRLTLRSTIDEYLAAKEREVRPRTFRQLKRYLTGGYLKPLHGMAVDTVGRKDVAARLVVITREHSSIVAARARAALSTFFVWSLRMGLCEHNPVIGSIQPQGGKPRERTLSDDELRRVWLACQDDDYGKIIKLAILLGVRRQEAGGMCWSELDVEGPQPSWRVPPERSKNHRPLVLPLMPMALAIIRGVSRRVSRDLLFGSYSSSGFTAWDKCKQELDERSGVTEWTTHDLRRSFSTKLHDLGVPPHIVEALLGHWSGHRAGPAGTYNRATYQGPMRAALAMWEDHIASLVEGRERKVLVLPQQSA